MLFIRAGIAKLKATSYHMYLLVLSHACSICGGSSCGRADSVMDSHTTGPGFKTRLVRHFLPSLRLTIDCVEGRGRISRSSLTQDIKMGSCAIQCNASHKWIAQRQMDPVAVYCDAVGCRILCLQHGIPVWQHIGQSITATSRHRRDMTSDV